MSLNRVFLPGKLPDLIDDLIELPYDRLTKYEGEPVIDYWRSSGFPEANRAGGISVLRTRSLHRGGAENAE